MGATTAAAAAAYLLVTVSGLGEVRSLPRSGLAACLDARRVALWGVGTAEDARAVAADGADRARRAAEWDGAHPFHPAGTPRQAAAVAAYARGTGYYDSRYEYRAPDLVRERVDLTEAHVGRVGDGFSMTYHAGRWYERGPHDATVAMCVPAEGSVGVP